MPGHPEDPVDEVKLPEPAETGAQANQAVGTPPLDLARFEQIGPKDALRAPGLEEVLTALAVRGRQVRGLLAIMFRQADRRAASEQARIERIQAKLTEETVAHARTDEKLKARQMQTGAQVMLQVFGSGLLGYGLAELKSPGYMGIAFCAIGILMVGFGCWPLISLRWPRRG